LGCTGLSPNREPSAVEEKADWAANLREPGPQGQQTGLDPRAREIERHLGIR
jgi:hypothetical protein